MDKKRVLSILGAIALAIALLVMIGIAAYYYNENWKLEKVLEEDIKRTALYELGLPRETEATIEQVGASYKKDENHYTIYVYDLEIDGTVYLVSVRLGGWEDWEVIRERDYQEGGKGKCSVKRSCVYWAL